MKPDDLTRIEIIASAGMIRRFSVLFPHGFKIEVPAGITVRDLLTGELKIDPVFLESGIQTILHDGRPVDEPGDYRLYADSAIALSSALPGLFGAAFRKKGTYAALRPFPGGTAPPHENSGKNIEIILKLFNTAAEALGPGLLNRGIRLSAEIFIDFWKCHPDLHQSPFIMAVRVDGIAVETPEITGRLASGEDIIFKVMAQ